MGIAELIQIIAAASSFVKAGIEIVGRLSNEGGDMTPEEIAALKLDQTSAEEAWAIVLANLRAKAAATTPGGE